MHNFKVFTNFEDGIKEIKSIIPNITTYIGDSPEEESVINSLMDKIKESIPSVSDPDFPSSYAFSISATEVGFKTKGFYSFGWKVIYDYETKKVSYSFRVSIRHYFKNEKEFLNLDWRQVPITYFKNKHKHNIEKDKAVDCDNAQPDCSSEDSPTDN
jgi:hypothetical protein